MAMELKVIENIQRLSWNFEDIKKELAAHVERYADLVVNEDNLPDMEKTCREVASLRVKISKFKAAVKKDFIKPYEQFEVEVKQLLELVEKAEQPIKDQIDKYETARRDKKRVQVQEWINKTSSECGLDEKYSTQIVVDEKWLNRTATQKGIIEDIQMRVAWFLDVQAKEREAESFRQEKKEMAKFLCESLSVGLVTPVTFADIENRIDALDLAGLRAHIENEVSRRKEREERAAKQALELAAKKEQEKQEIKPDLSVVPSVDQTVKPQAKQDTTLLNVQFVVYEVTDADINEIIGYLKSKNIKFKSAIKLAEQAG